MRRVALTLALALALAPQSARALDDPADELLTDRPDFTETTRAVRRGQVQIEGGLTYARHEDGDLETLNAPELLLRTGLLTGVELRLGMDAAWGNAKGEPVPGVVPSVGWSDAEPSDLYLGAKIELWKRESWGVALIPALVWPIVDEEDVDPEFVVAWSRDLPALWSVGGIAGYTFGDDDTERAFGGTVSFARPLAGSVGTFVEWAGESNEVESTHLLHHGYTLGLGRNAQLDLHVGLGLDEGAPDTFVGAGFAIRL